MIKEARCSLRTEVSACVTVGHCLSKNVISMQCVLCVTGTWELMTTWKDLTGWLRPDFKHLIRWNVFHTEDVIGAFSNHFCRRLWWWVSWCHELEYERTLPWWQLSCKTYFVHYYLILPCRGISYRVGEMWYHWNSFRGSWGIWHPQLQSRRSDCFIWDHFSTGYTPGSRGGHGAAVHCE